MREVLLALVALIFLVPVLSYGYNDCDEKCLKCDDHRCLQCNESYAISKIYARRLCVERCDGDQVEIWDPVLQSYICDKRRDCSKHPIPNCQQCLRSYSCVMCKDNYALKMRISYGNRLTIGLNECDKVCNQSVEPRSGAKVCNREDNCANCLWCEEGKCRQCEKGYAITKIYSRRLCVKKCGGDEEKVWDPVLQSHICDKRRNCSQNDSPSCQGCLRSYSCVKCVEGFALKMKKIGNLDIIGDNECDRDCEKRVEPTSGVKVCKTLGARFNAAEPEKPKKNITIQHSRKQNSWLIKLSRRLTQLLHLNKVRSHTAESEKPKKNIDKGEKTGFRDCATGCLKCKEGKCRQCEIGYAITKIYSRHLCEKKCGGNEEKVWDPVLQSYICDKRRNCSQNDSPSCQECLRSYSCVKCVEGFALKMKKIGNLDIIGDNECDRDCEKCVEPTSGVKVCKTLGAPCHAAEPDMDHDEEEDD